MRKTTKKTKNRTKRKMNTEKDKPDEKLEAKSAFQDELDRELDALRAICNAIETLDDAAKLRTFQYLKSKYGKSFPYDNP